MNESKCELKLPGFRFHPTEEELLNFYLKSMVFGKKFLSDVIGFLNIYNYDPIDLPKLAKIGEREWYFFVPRERKHGSGGRPNRTTENGFWKATGSDRQILSMSNPKKMVGLKKTLVFYQGRAPRGKKTEWIMNEYRLPDKCSAPKVTAAEMSLALQRNNSGGHQIEGSRFAHCDIPYVSSPYESPRLCEVDRLSPEVDDRSGSLSSSSSSSIGKNGDEQPGGGNGNEEEEVQSQYKGPLDNFDSLKEVLPGKL